MTSTTQAPIALRHRIMWSPITPAICLVVMTALTIVSWNVTRVFGLLVNVIWLGFAIHNWRSDGAYLRRLYAARYSGSPEIATARVVEPHERD